MSVFISQTPSSPPLFNPFIWSEFGAQTSGEPQRDVLMGNVHSGFFLQAAAGFVDIIFHKHTLMPFSNGALTIWFFSRRNTGARNRAHRGKLLYVGKILIYDARYFGHHLRRLILASVEIAYHYGQTIVASVG